MGPVLASRPLALLLNLLWLLPFLVAGWVTFYAEQSVAFGAERLLDAMVLCTPQLALAVVALWMARRWPTLGAALAALPLLLTLGWLLAAPPRADPPAAPGKGPDIVLVTLDTFRADHLGAEGGPVPTPQLDALAAAGARFRNAVSTAPLTAPSHASMLTGLSTTEHGLRQNGQAVAVETVVGQLRAAGWRTGAFVSSQVLDRDTGLTRGFERYEDRWGWRGRLSWFAPAAALLGRGPGERRGDATVERALRWFAAVSGPRLLWVHLFDAHLPYLPPKDWMPEPRAIRDAARQAMEAGRESGSVRDWVDDLDKRQAAGQRLLYGAEVRWVDALVGRLLAGLPSDAVVIVLGDHGESLGEHGYYFNHGGNLFEPCMRVPLLLRWAGRVEPGTVTESLVSVQDVAGTLLRAAGLETPLPSLLAPSAQQVEQYTPGQQVRARMSAPSAAIRRDFEKVVVTGDAAPMRYDLRADPGELSPTPVPPEREADAARAAALAASPPPALSEETLRRLEALGYMGAGR